MKEIVESYFKQRSLVNHQLASYNDCIPLGDGSLSRELAKSSSLLSVGVICQTPQAGEARPQKGCATRGTRSSPLSKAA